MIEVKFKYTEAEAIRSVVEITRSLSKPVIFMPWIGAAMILAGIALPLIQDGELFSRSSIPFLFGVLFGLLFIIIPMLTSYFARKNFRANPSANSEISWTISREDLHIKTASSEARFRWHQLVKIEEKKKGFLLFPQPRNAHWIPKSGFSCERDLDVFRDLIRNSDVEYKGGPPS